MRLEGKTAIVTGGASGIGRAICELFAEEGAKVVIADIDAENGEEVRAGIVAAGGEAQFVETDVSKEADVERMVQAAVDAYGAVNILSNNAAAFVFGEVQDITDADWRRVFDVNVVGYANGVKHVLPHMQAAGGGAIVNMASVSSFIAQPAFIPVQRIQGRGHTTHALPRARPRAAQHPRELRLPRHDNDTGGRGKHPATRHRPGRVPCGSGRGRLHEARRAAARNRLRCAVPSVR